MQTGMLQLNLFLSLTYMLELRQSFEQAASGLFVLIWLIELAVLLLPAETWRVRQSGQAKEQRWVW